jgi:hypothetical protein
MAPEVREVALAWCSRIILVCLFIRHRILIPDLVASLVPDEMTFGVDFIFLFAIGTFGGSRRAVRHRMLRSAGGVRGMERSALTLLIKSRA